MPTAAPPVSIVTALTTTQPVGPTFDASLRIPVASLSPTTTTLRSHIEANVALVWPYSNSTATFALLLIDHTSRGQVKVIFRGGCAKHVASTKVGIGDKIKLALLGCEWNETVDVISTPGKRLEWDLQYHSRLILQIYPQGQNAISLDYTALSESAETNTEPLLCSSDSIIQVPLNGIAHRKPSTIQVPYLTPSRSNRKSSEGTFFDSSIASLTDDDGYVVGRSRKRTKFARHSGAWNLIDNESEAVSETNSPRASKDDGRMSESSRATRQTTEDNSSAVQQLDDDRRNGFDLPMLNTSGRHEPSLGSGARIHSPPGIPPVCSDLKQDPYENGPGNTVSDPDFEQTSPVLSTTEPDANPPDRATAFMGPPSTPFRPLRLPQHPEVESSGTSAGDIDRATTPRILPLASPGLPLVSPLIQRSGVEVGYFPVFQDSLSQLDASGQNNTDEPTADSPLEISDKESTTSDESLVIVEERVSESREPVEMQKSDAFSDNQNAPSSDYSFQASGTQKTDQAEPALLPDQWLSTLEASIAQELSNNDHTSPIDIESERTISMTGNHTDSIYNAPIVTIPNKQTTRLSGVETEDLYGAPEDELIQPPQPPSRILEIENEDLHIQTQVVQSENNASEILSPNQQGDIVPVDAVEQLVHSSLVIDAVGLSSVPSASDFIPLGLQDRDERAIWTDSLDGNVDSRENFQETQRTIGSETASTTLNRTSVIDIEDRAQGASIAAEYSGPAAAGGFDADHADQDPVLMSREGGQAVVPSSVHMHVTQFKADADSTQLPTPDQTQKETYSIDHEHEYAQPEELVAPPSPEPSQETLPIIASGNERDEEQSQKSPSEALQPTTQSEPKAIVPPRSSQRLSSRNAAMSKSISSPYFTPRRSARFSTSPSREENIPPSNPLMSSFLSSPNPNTEPQEKPIDEKMAGLAHSPVLPSSELLAGRENGLITPLAYYTNLSFLHDHFGQLLDIIAVCSTSSTKPERAKSGPKDYHTSLHLVDPSCGPNHIPRVLAQVFRPVKKALPVAQAGDIVVLHNFKVHTTKRNFALLSGDTSSWAVISCNSNSSELEIVTSGPPLEQGSAEAAYASSLSRWWDGKQGTTTLNETDEIPEEERAARESSDGPATRTRLRVKSSPIQSSKTLPSKGRRRATLIDNIEIMGDQRLISDKDQGEEAGQIRASTVSPSQSSKPLDINRRRRANWTDNVSNEGDKGQVFEDSDLDDTPSPLADRTNKRRESTISTAHSTATQIQGKEFTPRRSTRTGRSPSVVHELRDGTKYVDEQGRSGNSVVHELRDGVTYVDE